MGLNKAIEAAKATIPSNEIVLRLTRHEYNKVAEALRSLSRSKQGKMRNLPEDARLLGRAWQSQQAGLG